MKSALEQLLEEDTFTVYLPNQCDLLKADRGETGADGSDRKIGGYCSTQDLDRQDEIVLARGLDFSEFINFGYFNDNHRQETAAQVGWPTLARLDKGERWWVEGYFWKSGAYKLADEIWTLAKAMRDSGSPRRLGFSIEGKVLQRNGERRIVRARVRDVAVTAKPVNTKCTWNILAKSFAPMDQVQKALTASYSHPAMAGGAVMVPESLDGLVIRRKNPLSFEQALEKVQRRYPHFNKSTCERVVRLAFERAGKAQ